MLIFLILHVFCKLVWHRSQSREIDCSQSSRNHAEDDGRTSEPRRRHRKHSEDLSNEQCGDFSNSREKSHRYHNEYSRRRTRQRDRRDHSDGSEKKSTSPDDRWDFTYDSDLTVDRSNWETGREESPRSEEFEREKSKRRKIISSVKDGLVRGKGEDSNSGRNSDRRKLEESESLKQFHHHRKKSERKSGSSRSRSQWDEASDDRDRWEPNKGDISD